MRSALLPVASLAAALVFAHPVYAADGDGGPALVRVSAGDIGRASRVAFNFTPAGGFRVEQSDRSVTVIFPGADLRFAYDAVYPRREASRVVFAGPAGRPDAPAFTLRFTCDCETSVAMDETMRVLVEVRERTPEPAATAAETPATSATSAGASDVAAGPAKPSALASIHPVPRPRPHRQPDAGKDGEPAKTAGRPDPPAGGVLSAHEIDRLRNSLRWAAQQGFIGDDRPAGDPPAGDPPVGDPPVGDRLADGAVKPPASAPATEAETAHAAPGRAETKPTPAPGSSAQPGGAMAGVPVSDTGGGMPTPDTVADCPPGDGEPMVAWQSVRTLGSDYLTALGRQRANLLSQAGPGALEEMALFYLAQGFTNEALAAVTTLEPQPERLREAALILLGRGEDLADDFAARVACHADAAVWRAAWLHAHHEPGAAAVAREAVGPLAGFPKHPKTVLALDLAAAALASGDAALATQLLELAEPAPGQDVDAQAAVLRGRVALAQGQGERAHWYFAKALQAGGIARQQARLALIADALGRGAAPPAWAEAAMQGALFDYRGDPHLLPVALLAADLHAAAGEPALALAALDEAAHRLPETTNRAPLAAKARQLLQDAFADPETLGDADALRLFRDHSRYLRDDAASTGVRHRLAERLLAAGLPAAAASVLAPLAENGQGQPDTVLLLAEAALRRGKPQEVLTLLSAGNAPAGAAADALRARALTQLGRYAEAAPLAAPDEAAALQWAGGDWSKAVAAYGDALAAVSPDRASPADAAQAVRALAASFMAGPDNTLPPALAAKAVAIANAGGLGDAAAALTAKPLADGLPLPDAITAALERSRQVRSLFPAPQPGS